jgi:sugar phosphate permease
MVDSDETTLWRVKLILSNPVFVFLALCISGLYFLSTGIQYWISDYLQTVLAI